MCGCACVEWVVCVRVERYDDLRISKYHDLCGKVICDQKILTWSRYFGMSSAIRLE